MSESVDAKRLLMRFADLGILLHQALVENVARLEASPELVSNAGVAILLRLQLDGPMRPSEIGEITGLSSGGVTKFIDRLERDGLVDRLYGQVPGDARGVEVRITPTGRLWAKAIADAFNDHLSEFTVFLKDISEHLGR